MGAATDGGDGDHNATSKQSANSRAVTQEKPNARTQPDEEEDEEEEEDEPKLKYNRLTGHLGAVYRNGDATSSFLVSGDKMIIGTHNGNIHILLLPNLQSLRTYRAHSASITAISVSPPVPTPTSWKAEVPQRDISSVSNPARVTSNPSAAAGSPSKASKQAPIPNLPSNAIHIGTASIDGKVCVSSLIDAKDVTLRNFARPVQAVALSPDFKNDRTYLSGGLAGNLIMTTGGKAGVSADANTNSAAAAASGWLGSMGIGSNTGKDTILHSGEGSISTIKWSLSGKYVAWVNEEGIKIMRSHNKLDSADSEIAWKRIAHIDRPQSTRWEEMASVWKARADWIDDNYLETDDDVSVATSDVRNDAERSRATPSAAHKKIEKLVVGWGDAAWVIQVQMGSSGTGKDAKGKFAGSASIVHKLRFDDCIVSGLSLYTPSLLLVLAYRTHDDDSRPLPSNNHDTPRRGRQHRQTGIPPEIRLIDLSKKDVVDEDTLSVSRFETLSASDYHLSTLFVPRPQIVSPAQKGAFEALGDGLWDAGRNATRIFSSGASVKSHNGSLAEKSKGSPAASGASIARDAAVSRRPDAHPFMANPGLKIFLQSPYDCVLSIRREDGDRLEWLLERQQFQGAWELLEKRPEALNSVTSTASDRASDSSPSTPAKTQQSLVDFFADDGTSQSASSAGKAQYSAVEKEKRRIGDLWLQQLVSARRWADAGRVAGKVLGTSSRWEHWVWTFAEAGKFDEITPHIPTAALKPPLPSMVYEVVLGHYIAKDRTRLRDLLEEWDPELFNTSSVTSAIEAKLKSGDVSENTIEDGVEGRDWRILMEALQKLYLADGRPKDALRCCIKLQNADEAMHLISTYHLLDAVADDIPGLILLRISKAQLADAPLSELETYSKDAITLLVDEAHRGIVTPDTVVSQLTNAGPALQPFLFFYLRALWQGDASDALLNPPTTPTNPISKTKPTHTHPRHLPRTHLRDRLASDGRALITTHFANLALRLFASYSPPLLLPLLRTSPPSLDLGAAIATCATAGLTRELVFLYARAGDLRAALRTIVAEMRDAKEAVAFVRDEGGGEKGLWRELVKEGVRSGEAGFVRGLLAEVGTGLMGVDGGEQQEDSDGEKRRGGDVLIRGIPEGMEIEGLKEAVGLYLRGYEIQAEISAGVARVLRGEVAGGMARLREGRARGVRFEVGRVEEEDLWSAKEENEVEGKNEKDKVEEEEVQKAEEPAKPGHCVQCHERFTADETRDTLVGFACGHVYHLSCILDSSEANKENVRAAEDLQARFQADAEGTSSRSVGAKVAHAHVIRRAIGSGCPLCTAREEIEEL
ncbi:MAG: Vacuolar protein sorting-associated protein 41 [Bathelium mastoideum]|nr:MAG: Vacuolar protein sorting-associated protein 41 [Bathelium mastoideum]